MLSRPARRVLLVLTLIVAVPGLAWASAPTDRAVEFVVTDMTWTRGAADAEAASAHPGSEGVVAGHTAYAVLDVGHRVPEAPATVDVVGLVSCGKSLAGVRVALPAALDGALFGCTLGHRVWVLPADQAPPASPSDLVATGWHADVRTPAGGVARTVEYTYTTGVTAADGESVQAKGVLWETVTRTPEVHPATRAPYNFAFGLNADRIDALGVERFDVTLPS